MVTIVSAASSFEKKQSDFYKNIQKMTNSEKCNGEKFDPIKFLSTLKKVEDGCKNKKKSLVDRTRCILQSASFLPEISKPFKDEKKLAEKLKSVTIISAPSFPDKYASAYFASKCPKKLAADNDEEGIACILDLIIKTCTGKH
ncbi:unnamed protein product [Allacma fusca]|uniref:Uncharacterized protein n=1 Tax=Allacma fusca TaxID=39272 RepID=A0A8J2NVI5_9HEXA|nr:unnamed protein product [Allacma fusca]